MNKIDNIIIILAAGKGTRMKSDLPKVLHTINNMPMIKKVIDTSKQLKPYKIIVIVGYKKELVIKKEGTILILIFLDNLFNIISNHHSC